MTQFGLPYFSDKQKYDSYGPIATQRRIMVVKNSSVGFWKLSSVLFHMVL